MESSLFWPSVLRVALYETVFFDFFYLGPPNAQIYFPKFYRPPVCWCSRRANQYAYTHMCDGSNGQSVHTKTCMWGRPLLPW